MAKSDYILRKSNVIWSFLRGTSKILHLLVFISSVNVLLSSK